MKKLLTLLAFAFVAFTANAQSTQKGDVNGDGDVSVNDVAMIVNYILGVANDNFIAANADVNGDGEIDINDVMGAVSIILEGNQSEQPTPDDVIDLVVGQITDVLTTYYSETDKVSNSNPTVATVEIQDGRLIVTGISKGRTTITVTNIYNNRYTFEVRVSKLCPDDNHPHMIDLGLPSGTLWACCNVDTDNPDNQSPTNYGGYYAWGETYTKDLYDYDSSGYQHIFTDTILYENGYNSWLNNDIVSDKTYYYHYSYIGSNICGTKYDVAHVKWGNAWQMPTHDQMVELIDNVTFRSTNINGVNGGLFTSRVNGASIFLPYADYYERDYPALNKGYMGWYRTGTLHPKDDYNNGIFTTWGLTIYDSKNLNSLYQFDGEAIVDILDRISGFSVRPVWIP